MLGAAAVALGAFGAHSLNELLEESGRTEIWKTASTYHLIHSLLLLFLGWHGISIWRCGLLIAGTLIFSGSLYLLCLTGHTWLGAITPIGGTLLILVWFSLVFINKENGRS